MVSIVFLSYAYSKVRERVFFPYSNQSKDGVAYLPDGFLPDGKGLYLEPKYTFKEIEMVRNKHQEDLTDELRG